MTRDDKLAYHLEMVIWEGLPEGTQLSAGQVYQLMAVATDAQKQRAHERALVISPILLSDERIPSEGVADG